MTQPVIDFWFDFASTYSYPAAMRAPALAEQAGVRIQPRPFLLGPIFKAHGWDNSPFNIYESKGRYMWRDIQRICDALGIPFQKPGVFPQNGLLAARTALAGETQPWQGEFCRAVFSAQFAECKRIDDPAVIGDILSALGTAPRDVFDLAQSEPLKHKLRAQTEQAGSLGIFGAPSFVTEDRELFWGNDRLEAAIAWAKKNAGT